MVSRITVGALRCVLVRLHGLFAKQLFTSRSSFPSGFPPLSLGTDKCNDSTAPLTHLDMHAHDPAASQQINRSTRSAPSRLARIRLADATREAPHVTASFFLLQPALQHCAVIAHDSTPLSHPVRFESLSLHKHGRRQRSRYRRRYAYLRATCVSTTNRPDLIIAYEKVRSDKDDETWALFDYQDEKSNKLQLTETGTGDIAEFASKLDNGRASYGFVRVKYSNDEHSTREKFVFVIWIGPDVKVMRRARVSPTRLLEL
jgi:hypothetical protein